MEISKVISIFEKCIPVYQQAVDEKWSVIRLIKNKMDGGLCKFVLVKHRTNVLYGLFPEHYCNYISWNIGSMAPGHGYIYPILKRRNTRKQNVIKLCILPRLNFLKTEVIRLKKLQQKGYTHI